MEGLRIYPGLPCDFPDRQGAFGNELPDLFIYGRCVHSDCEKQAYGAERNRSIPCVKNNPIDWLGPLALGLSPVMPPGCQIWLARPSPKPYLPRQMPEHSALANIAVEPPETGCSQSIHNRKPRVIVCAALQHRTHKNRIIASVHHGDRIMVAQMQPMENPGDFVHGFLCSRGLFLTRAEAAEAAVAAGQVEPGNVCLMSTELF